MQSPKLIIHGGAWSIPTKYEQDHLDGIREALLKANKILINGGSALDAVELAINVLELNPTYDAGRGAFLNAKGEVELDAIIVDGRDVNFGAVAGVQNLMHPVSLARKVMEDTEHCMIVGSGAQDFAVEQGFDILDPKALLTDRELQFYEAIKNDPNFKTKIPFEQMPMDTVGAVALDQAGNFATATSTGGTARKKPGRVGDSPILGAGAYADNRLGASSTTGWGESIMRSMLAKRVIDEINVSNIEDGLSASFQFLENRIQGLAGVIGISKNGKYFHHYNTPKMAFGYIDESGTCFLQIKSEVQPKD